MTTTNGYVDRGVYDYSSGANNHKQGSNPKSTVTPPPVFHFFHWAAVWQWQRKVLQIRVHNH